MTTCPGCGGDRHAWWGMLGGLAHFKCRNCDMEFSTDADNIAEGDGSWIDPDDPEQDE